MKILSLDIATKTGWATNIAGKKSGVAIFEQKRGESPGIRFLRCRAWLGSIHNLIGGYPELMVYEQPHHRGGAATSIIIGLLTEVLAFAAAREIDLMTVHSATLKKFATGNGRANKDLMIDASKNFGWDPKDDNEADASLLLEYAMDDLNLR